MSSSEKQVNVLMVTAAYQGHLNPTLRFAERLASKGVRVTLTLTEDARSRMLKSNAFSSLNANSHNPNNIQLEFFSDGLSLDFDRNKDTATFLASFETKGVENFSNLITNLSRDRNYSCLITNPFLPCVAEVAATHGIPCAMLWFQASALFSIYYHYVEKTNTFSNLESPNETVQLPGLPLLGVRDLPTLLLPSYPHVHKKLVWDFIKTSDKLKWVLGDSFLEIEGEVVNSMASLSPILTIGPLVSPFLLGEKAESSKGLSVDLYKAEESCLEWLDNQPRSSVIYVAFGSMMVLSQKQMDNTAMALRNSNRAFLWVIRPTKKGSEENGGELPPGFVEETRGRGLVVTWCPQEKVLMHPAVACFVSHCGWNSTLEAVAAGVPIIAHPNWSDQPTNAKLIADVFKNGVKMTFGEDGTVSKQEVERCIKEVMEGPKAAEINKRAMELKAAARKALADGGSSDRNINQFLNEISGHSSVTVMRLDLDNAKAKEASGGKPLNDLTNF